jgi:uncharacterized protein (DUF1778 family)
MYCELPYIICSPFSTAISSMANASASLMVRLDPDSKTFVARAAELRHVSVSDYVRSVVVAQARREIQAAEERVITLTPAEQLEFWQALQEPTVLTPAQRALGALIRGE